MQIITNKSNMDITIIEYVKKMKIVETCFISKKDNFPKQKYIESKSIRSSQPPKPFIENTKKKEKQENRNKNSKNSKYNKNTNNTKNTKNVKKNVVDNEYFLYGKYIGHSGLLDKNLIWINVNKQDNLLEVSIPKDKKRKPLQFPITNLYPVAQKEIYKFIIEYAQKYQNNKIFNELQYWNSIVKKTIHFRNKYKENKFVMNKLVVEFLIKLA